MQTSPSGEAGGDPAPPTGALYRLANLPLPYLLGIAVALAILAALLTSALF
jgi:hypothetical protein